MKQFFACGNTSDIRPVQFLRYKNVLVSYFYYTKGGLREHIKNNKDLYSDFFMDSGAFSAMNSGKVINIDEYINILKEDNIEKYSSLDAIGNPLETKNNYEYMLNQGMNPVPCFHINTDIEYLYYYLDKCDSISIGGMVMASNIHGNLDKIFCEILKRNPQIKIHGFGVSNPDTAIKYPFTSIDSSTFCAIGKFSRALIWNKTQFETIDTFDLLNTKFGMKMDMEKRSVGGIRDFLLFWQMEQFNQMIDYVNEKQNNKDFSHLTSQYQLF